MGPCSCLPIIVHSNMSNISIIQEVLRSLPTDYSCHYNSLYTCEKTSLFKTKTAFRVYYQMYGNHVSLTVKQGHYTWWITFNEALIWAEHAKIWVKPIEHWCAMSMLYQYAPTIEVTIATVVLNMF